jgi:hypothetical protein
MMHARVHRHRQGQVFHLVPIWTCFHSSYVIPSYM